MYKDKKFRIRDPKEVLEDLAWARAHYRQVRRIFLCDGDALALTNGKLLPILKEDFARAGVKLEILSLEWSVMLERIDKRQFDAVRLAWRMSVSNDPYQLWHSDNLKIEASSNFISFANPEADRLIMEIRTCFDLDKRTELYHRFHRLIHEEEPYLFLVSPYDLFVINKRYQNVVEYPLGVYQNTFWVPKAKQMAVPGL